MRMSASTETGLRTLSAIAQSTSNPYAQAIVALASTIVTTIQASREETKDLLRLSDRVLEVGMICAAALKNENMTPELAISGAQLLTALEGLGVSVTKALSRGRVYKFLTRSSIQTSEQELEHCISIFALRMQISSLLLSAHMSTEAAAMQRTEIEMRVSENRQEELKLIRSKAKSHTFSLPYQTLPAEPQIFFGREEALKHLTELFSSTKQGFVAILGAGGIGKTSLALSVIHCPKVKDIFGRYRYFLACDSFTSAEALEAGISQLFHLPEQQSIIRLAECARIISSQIILTLDNFETPWEPQANRAAVEKIISQLADIPNLSLLFTLRGAERPYGIPWHRPFLPVLQPLDALSAKQVFVAISDVSENDPSLDELLKLIDNVPLAVTLVASQAQYTTCATLLSSWQRQKTAMVTRGFASRLSSLDVSIQTSLKSERFLQDPDALRLLQVLAFLPDGVHTSVLPSMTDIVTSGASSTLKRVALAHTDEKDKLRSLSPIREHTKAYFPPDINLFTPVFRHHGSLATYAEASSAGSTRREMIKSLTPQIGNIHSVIHHGLQEPSLAEEAIQATLDITSYHKFSFPGSISSLLRHALDVSRIMNMRNLEISCLRQLAWSADLEEQRQYYEDALSLSRELGDNDEIARSLAMASHYYRQSNQQLKAFQMLEAALQLASDATPPHWRSHYLIWQSQLYALQSNILKATETAQLGLKLVEGEDRPQLIAQCYERISGCFALRCLFDKAIDFQQRSVNLHGIDNGWSAGVYLHNLGVLYIMQSRLTEASKLLNQSYEILDTHDKRNWAFNAQTSIALVALLRSDFTQALALYENSLPHWMLTKRKGMHAKTVLSICEVELHRRNFITAASHNLEAKRLLREANYVNASKNATVPLLMGDTLFHRSRLDEALTYYVTSASLYRSRQCRLGIAQCIQRLGDIFMSDDVPNAKACFETTLALIKYLGMRRHLGDCLIRLTMIDIRLDDIESGILHLTQAQRFYTAAEHGEGREFCTTMLAACKQRSQVLYDPPPLPLATTITTILVN